MINKLQNRDISPTVLHIWEIIYQITKRYTKEISSYELIKEILLSLENITGYLTDYAMILINTLNAPQNAPTTELILNTLTVIMKVFHNLNFQVIRISLIILGIS